MGRLMDFYTRYKKEIAILLGFGICYGLVSIVNHYFFRTSSFDLGIYNNAIFDYRQLKPNDCMLMQPKFTNVLSDHFTLLQLFVAPFSYLFGTYTLLLFQIVALLFGALGSYKLVLNEYQNPKYARWAMVHFCSIWGVYAALSFDYHDNVIGTMFISWLFLSVKKGNILSASFFLLLICISKENMALFAIFFCIGSVFVFKSTKNFKVFLWFAALFCGVYFVCVTKIVMPYLANGGREYLHFQYSALGNNIGEAIRMICTQPWKVCTAFFVNHMNTGFGNGTKIEMYYTLLLSGGLLIFVRPKWAVFFMPIVAQKVLNDDIQKWGLNYQYCIEFVPLLSALVFLELKNTKHQDLLLKLALGLTIGVTVWKLQTRVSPYYNKEVSQFYNPSHFKRNFDVSKMHQVLDAIPDKAKVSASSQLVPHLAFREYIYHFPVIHDADFVVLVKEDKTWPITSEEYYRKIDSLSQAPNWKIISEVNSCIVFERN